jgi:hypothetical protein
MRPETSRLQRVSKVSALRGDVGPLLEKPLNDLVVAISRCYGGGERGLTKNFLRFRKSKLGINSSPIDLTTYPVGQLPLLQS